MNNCKIIEFNKIGDEYGGYLVAIEDNLNIPFDIKRVYYTYGVKDNKIRGKHAHRNLDQILLCLNGAVKVKCFDGYEEIEIHLDDPSKGIFIGSMVWHEMYDYREDAVIMVIADDYYNESDYIRDYDEFISLCKEVNS